MTDKARPRGRCYLRIPTIPYNCHPDGAATGGDWRDLQPGIPATNEKKPCLALKKPHDANRTPKPSSWRSVHRGRSMVCEETIDYSQPPMGSRGRGPWSGRGSQRVKPRLVSPFEKRRLFPKGQRFLRVDGPKAGPCHLRGKNSALFPKRHTMSTEPQHRAAGGRWGATGRWHAKAPPPAPSPYGVQGPRPLVGKGFSKGETTIGFAL